MKTFVGNQISESFRFFEKLEKRNVFPILMNYLETSLPGRICLLSGLRRTGKSVLMFQAALTAPERSAYLLCQKKDTLDVLGDTIDDLQDAGIDRIFVDEVTLLSDFIDNGQFLADINGLKSKIVLSGTDSLAMWFASHAIFSGRAEIIRTTRIPFIEHCRLLGTTSLDEYARCGGILVDASEFADYPLEAIAFNIQNSLDHYQSGSRFGTLEDLREKNLLTTFIQKVILDENHRFIGNILSQEEWKLSDYTQVRNCLDNPDAKRIAKKLKIQPILEKVRKNLDIINSGKIKPTYQQSWELLQYFKALDLIEPCLILTSADLTWENEDEGWKKVFDKLSIEKRFENPRGEWTLLQPGLRWAQVDALLKVLETQIPSEENPEAIQFLFDRIRSAAMGHIMEDIIVSETRATTDANVFKYRTIDGEIDMVIQNRHGLDLYEIKHASIPHSDHWKNLNKENSLLQERFGKINSKTILYTGNDNPGYLNAAEYLSNLSNHEETPKPEITFMP